MMLQIPKSMLYYDKPVYEFSAMIWQENEMGADAFGWKFVKDESGNVLKTDNLLEATRTVKHWGEALAAESNGTKKPYQCCKLVFRQKNLKGGETFGWENFADCYNGYPALDGENGDNWTIEWRVERKNNLKPDEWKPCLTWPATFREMSLAVDELERILKRNDGNTYRLVYRTRSDRRKKISDWNFDSVSLLVQDKAEKAGEYIIESRSRIPGPEPGPWKIYSVSDSLWRAQQLIEAYLEHAENYYRDFRILSARVVKKYNEARPGNTRREYISEYRRHDALDPKCWNKTGKPGLWNFLDRHESAEEAEKRIMKFQEETFGVEYDYRIMHDTLVKEFDASYFKKAGEKISVAGVADLPTIV